MTVLSISVPFLIFLDRSSYNSAGSVRDVDGAFKIAARTPRYSLIARENVEIMLTGSCRENNFASTPANLPQHFTSVFFQDDGGQNFNKKTQVFIELSFQQVRAVYKGGRLRL